jgi:hypothetical protein
MQRRHAGQQNYSPTHSDLGIRHRLSASSSGPFALRESSRNPPNRRLGRSSRPGMKIWRRKTFLASVGNQIYLDRSARNKFTTVTELSSFTSAKETMQVNFYKTEDFCLYRKMWFWVLKYVRCEDCHHPTK